MPRTNAIRANEFVSFSSPSKSTRMIDVRHMADACNRKGESEKFVNFMAKKST